MKRPSPKRQTRADLVELQRRTFAAIRRPLSAGGGMQRQWPDGRAATRVLGEFIKPNDRLDSFSRLEIYNKQYWCRLLDCLHDDFPGLRAVLGQRRFDRLLVAYLDCYPSRSYTLRDLGSRLPQFLAEQPRWGEPHFELAQDLARFEWARVVAFDGPEKPSIGATELVSKNPGRLRLSLQPHVTLLRLDYPLDDFLIAVQRRSPDPQQLSNAVAGAHRENRPPRVRRPQKQPTWLAVYRHDNGIYYKRLDRVAFAILCGLRDGKTVEDACADGLAHAENPESDEWMSKVAAWFGEWTRIGWLCSRSRR